MKKLALIILLLPSLALAQQTQTTVQSAINSNITTNGNNAITGAKLNSVLTTMNVAIFQGLQQISILSLPGVVCDRVTNTSVALNAQLVSLSAAGGAVISIPENTLCAVGGSGGEIYLKSNIYFVGTNQYNSGFTQLIPENTNIFVGSSITNSGFSNLVIHGGDAAGSSYPNAEAIAYATSTNWFVQNVTIDHSPTYGVAFYGGNAITVENNTITLTTATGTYQNAGIFGAATNVATNFLVDRNTVINTGILISGQHGRLDSNIILGNGYGAGINTTNGTNYGINLTNNIIYQSLHVLDANGVMPGGIEADAAYSIISYNVVSQMGGNGITVFGLNNVVSSNITIDNGQGGNSSFATGLEASYSSGLLNASGTIFSDNMSGNSAGGTTQLYGYGEYNGAGGNLSGIQLIGNNFANNATGRLNLTSTTTTEISGQNILLPIADPHIVGKPWSNSGVVTISAG